MITCTAHTACMHVRASKALPRIVNEVAFSTCNRAYFAAGLRSHHSIFLA